MRFIIGVAVVAAALASSATAPVWAADCEAVRCALQSAINDPETGCQCDAATNHGQYVSCVAHKVKELARTNPDLKTCKGKVKRCAARSTCGKENFITCTVPTDTCGTPCTADPSATCCSDATTACATDADCGTRCTTKHAEPGTETTVCPAPGVVGSGSCCASCS